MIPSSAATENITSHCRTPGLAGVKPTISHRVPPPCLEYDLPQEGQSGDVHVRWTKGITCLAHTLIVWHMALLRYNCATMT